MFFCSPDSRMFGMSIKVGGVGLEGDLQQVGLRGTSHQQLVKDVCWLLYWVPDPALTSSLPLAVPLLQPQSAIRRPWLEKMHCYQQAPCSVWRWYREHSGVSPARCDLQGQWGQSSGPGSSPLMEQAVRLGTGRPFSTPSDISTCSWNRTLERVRSTFPLGHFSFLQPCRTEEDTSLARPEGGRKGVCAMVYVEQETVWGLTDLTQVPTQVLICRVGQFLTYKTRLIKSRGS